MQIDNIVHLKSYNHVLQLREIIHLGVESKQQCPQ